MALSEQIRRFKPVDLWLERQPTPPSENSLTLDQKIYRAAIPALQIITI